VKRVILTGATGFVGANLARRLLHDGHEVHALVRKGYTVWRIEDLQPSLQLHEADISDASEVARVIQAVRPEWVFHLAAYGGSSWQKDERQMVESNLVSTIHLVNACAKTGVEVLVNTGTSSEYGYKDHAPKEDDWLEPNSGYALTKASATMYCRLRAQQDKLNIPTLRLYSAFGPYENPLRLIPTLVLSGMGGRLPPLVNPDIARDYIFMDDVVDAYLKVAAHTGSEPGAIYNIGTARQTTLREAVNIVTRVMKLTVDPRWGSMPDRDWDTSVWVSANQKAVTKLGWKPRFSFEEGFRQTVAWVESVGRNLEPYRQRTKELAAS